MLSRSATLKVYLGMSKSVELPGKQTMIKSLQKNDN